MKRTLLLTVAVSIAVLTSCDPKPPIPPEAPFPIGAWRTTNQYYDRTVDRAEPEELRGVRELETAVDVTEAEAYRLTFNEDGTGYGSGIRPDDPERYDFGFTWQLSDGKLIITKAESGYGAVFYVIRGLWKNINWNEIDTVEDIVWEESPRGMEQVIWNVEKASSDEMVLSTSWRSQMEVSEWWYRLDETHTYRYTFERVK